MSVSRPSLRSFLKVGLIFAHLALPAGLWLAIRIGRPRFLGLALYIVTAVLLIDILIFIGRSSVETALEGGIDVRIPTILFIGSGGLLALLGPGIVFYSGITATLVVVIFRVLARGDSAKPGWSDLGLVCGSSVLLIASQVLTVAYFVRVADNVNHTTTAMVLRDSGWLSAISATRYFAFSAFHVLASTGMRFTQLRPRLFIAVFMIALFQIALVAVFLFFRHWGQSRSLALIGTLLVSINISFFHYGSIAHYQSMSFVLFCVFLAILARGNWSVRDVAVTTPILTTWIVTHHVSVLMAIALLAVPIGYLAVQIWTRGREAQERPTVFMFTTFCLMFGAYWIVVTTKFREVLVWVFFSSSAAEGIPSDIYLVRSIRSIQRLVYESLPFFVDSLHYSFLLALAFIGVLVVATADRFRNQRWRLVLVGFVPAAVIYFPNPVWIPLEGLIPFNRWRLMVLPFLLLVPAVGIRYGLQPAIGTRLRQVGVLLFTVALVFTTVTSGMSHPNLTDLAGIEKGSQQYLTEEELSASEFTFAYLTDGQRVHARTDLRAYLRQYAWARDTGHRREQFSTIRASQSNRRLITGQGLTIISVEAFRAEGMRVQVVDPASPQFSGARLNAPVHASDYRWNRDSTNVVYSNGAVVIQHR